MPYISKESVALKRKLLKAKFPDYKLSVVCRNYSKIDVSILEGPLELLSKDNPYGYETINPYYINGDDAKVELLKGIRDIIDQDNGVISTDSDYGEIPDFYIGISIGRWDKPYIVKK